VIHASEAPAARAIRDLTRQLLARRRGADHWDGHLASSALSTATAVLALHLVSRATGFGTLSRFVEAGAAWLLARQNAGGGWGDTIRSRSNISTTAIVWATLSAVAGADGAAAIARARAWLDRASGGSTRHALRAAILNRYGSDQTFSVPILTLLALAGQLDDVPSRGWRSIPQLPFELAALPHGWFQHLSLPVVSYALPALIAIGQVRHHHAPSRNPVTRLIRERVRRRTLRVLREMQPASGGYLEATPLTSFVVMSLAGMGEAGHPVVEAGVRFLTESVRDDGSWPIDSNLATWVTTLSIGAMSTAGTLPAQDVEPLREWLLAQQSTTEHPFTHAAPGAWAWTPLSGGVPDADDTSGALLALWHLGADEPRAGDAAARGVRWLVDVQNRDGGVPTFCRGWGTLPFDRSTPEITAHALQAWSAWAPRVGAGLRAETTRAARRALAFVARAQRPDGAWIPLWFGNEHAADEHNPVYGTSRVLIGLCADLVRNEAAAIDCRERGAHWLIAAQNADGGWGGDTGAPSTVEETGVALAALACIAVGRSLPAVAEARTRGTAWLLQAVAQGVDASPIGLYFARLWYYEELYPLTFALAGLAPAAGEPR
jgi:squalene-hopene/tetraprenyl-beta-curcumene cyclase